MRNPVEDMQQELQRIIAESGIPMMELSRRSGVAYNTLRSIAHGEGNPTMRSLEAVWNAIFKRRTAECGESCMNCALRGSDMDDTGTFLCELALMTSFDTSPCAAWKKESKQ